jgi:hypothetical protein
MISRFVGPRIKDAMRATDTSSRYDEIGERTFSRPIRQDVFDSQ